MSFAMSATTSTVSTPKKRRKTETEHTFTVFMFKIHNYVFDIVTSTTLVNSLPEEMVDSMPDLVKRLEKEGTFASFQCYIRKWQIRILKDAQSLLVDEIMKHMVMVSAGGYRCPGCNTSEDV